MSQYNRAIRKKMEFNIGQQHNKGEIKKARRKALKIQKQKLQVIDQSSSSSPSQGKRKENPEPANLEKEKIENLKQIIVKQEETIFNLSNQIREILTNYDQLNIEIDQLKDLLVKKNYITREQIQSQTQLPTSQYSKMEIEANQNLLSNILTPQCMDQQDINKNQDTLIKRIENIEKKLEKKTQKTISRKKC